MKSYEHSSHSSVRATLGADKVIGMFLASTRLKHYRGVLENYIRWSLSTLKSEGKQAQDRLKAYKLFYENALAKKQVELPSGKYKKLIPLLRILQELLDNDDYASIRWLSTVVTAYELARPSQKQMQKDLWEFVSTYGRNLTKVGENPQALNMPVTLNFRDIAASVMEEVQMYPSFPWQEYWDYLDEKSAVLRELVTKTAPRPPLTASFLTKSSASKIKIKQKDGSFKFKSIPAICLADVEQAIIKSQCENTDYLPQIFADALLDSLQLTESYSFKGYDPEVVMDEEALRRFAEEDILLMRIATVAIEASNGIKTRIVHKCNYASQHPLELFHDSLLAVCQEIPGDYSGSHEEGFRSLNEYAKTADYLCDVDATAWTDNFPLAFQYFAIKAAYGEVVASSWYGLMRQPLCVYLTNLETGERDLYTYELFKGQPMGAYGSWAAANFSHHILYRFAKRRSGSEAITKVKVINKEKGLYLNDYALPYWIIGDDFCGSDSVAQVVYVSLLSSLGVPVNAVKSKTLTREHHRYLAELVNRQSLAGVEVSRISPKLLGNSLLNFTRLANTLEFLRSRGVELNENHFVSSLLKESCTLSTHQYKTKYGSYPIRKRQIEVGLQVPSCVGGLVPDNSNWNSNVEPRLLLVAMLSKISSVMTVLRPGAPILRDGRDNTDKVLTGMQHLPDIFDVDKTTLARYERRVYQDTSTKLFLREVGLALDRLMHAYQMTFLSASVSDYSTIDLEAMKEWFLQFLKNLDAIAPTPAYLARERRISTNRIAIRMLMKLHPDNFSSLDSWSNKINLEFQVIRDRIQHLSGSIFDKKDEDHRQDELQALYESLWAEAEIE